MIETNVKTNSTVFLPFPGVYGRKTIVCKQNIGYVEKQLKSTVIFSGHSAVTGRKSFGLPFTKNINDVDVCSTFPCVSFSIQFSLSVNFGVIIYMITEATW